MEHIRVVIVLVVAVFLSLILGSDIEIHLKERRVEENYARNKIERIVRSRR